LPSPEDSKASKRTMKREVVAPYYGYPTFDGSWYRSLSEKEVEELDAYSMNPRPTIRATISYYLHVLRKRLLPL